jgi:WD40 repeat protein
MSHTTANLLSQHVLPDIANIILEYLKFAGQFLRSEKIDARGIAALPNGEVACANDSLRIWSPQGVRHLGHTEGYQVNCILYLPSGMLVLATEAGPIMFYTLKGTLVRTVYMHSEAVVALVLLSGGHLASGSTDATICVWDVDAGVCICTHFNDWSVFALAALPKNRLASGGRMSTTIKIWNESSLEKSFAEPDPFGFIDVLETLPGGNLASGSASGKISVWDVDAGIILYELLGNTPRVYSLLSMDDLLLSISGGKLYVWNTKTRELVNTAEVFLYGFNCAMVSGDTLVYVGACRSVIWLE